MLAIGRKLGCGTGRVRAVVNASRGMKLPFCVACLATGELEHHPGATP